MDSRKQMILCLGALPAAGPHPISSTTRPRTLPARISGANAGASATGRVRVMAASCEVSRSRARRDQAAMRLSFGAMTLSMPANVTPRKMNGGHGRGQVHPLRQAARCNAPAIPGHRQRVRECMAPDRIDGARPTLLAQRPTGGGQLRPIDDLLGPQTFQVISLTDPPCRGDHVMPEFGQESHRNTADTASRACHQHWAFRRGNTVVLQRHDREHGCIARRSDRHRLGGTECCGLGHQPVSLDPRHLRIAAQMRLPNAPPIEKDGITRRVSGVAGRLDSAREVDPGDHRPAPDDGGFAGERQAILVVDRRMADPNRDIPLHEVRFAQLGPGEALPRVGFGQKEGVERAHGRRAPGRCGCLVPSIRHGRRPVEGARSARQTQGHDIEMHRCDDAPKVIRRYRTGIRPQKTQSILP